MFYKNKYTSTFRKRMEAYAPDESFKVSWISIKTLKVYGSVTNIYVNLNRDKCAASHGSQTLQKSA